MKSLLVTAKDLAGVAAEIAEVSGVLAKEVSHVGFFLTPDGPNVVRPDGISDDDVKILLDGPVARMGYVAFHAERLFDALAGIAALNRLQVAFTDALASVTDEGKTMIAVHANMTDWLARNIIKGAQDGEDGHAAVFRSCMTEVAAGMLVGIDTKVRAYAKTQELCEKEGINFDAFEAQDPVALKAVADATVRDMKPDALRMFNFVARGLGDGPFATVVRSAVAARLATLPGVEDEAAGASFQPSFGGGEPLDAIRA